MTIEVHQGIQTATLVRRDDPRYALEPQSFTEAWQLAQVVAKSGLCNLTSPEQAFVVLQTGRELGLSAMQSLRGIYAIDNKPSLYADTMLAIVRASGLCERWDLVESTPTKCRIVSLRRGTETPVTVEWTIDRANRIYMDAARTKALTSKSIWQNHPAEMLRHRATAELARALYPDVVLGLYTPEEMESVAPERADVRIVDVSPRREPATAAVTDTTPETEETLRAAFASATTPADVDAVRRRVPDRLRKALGAALTEARKRVTPPNDDGPKGGGAPKPAAPAPTDAAGGSHTADASDGNTALALWTARMATHSTPQHVLASHAAHIDEVPVGVREACANATARRLATFASHADADDTELAAEIAAAVERRTARRAA